MAGSYLYIYIYISCMHNRFTRKLALSGKVIFSGNQFTTEIFKYEIINNSAV